MASRLSVSQVKARQVLQQSLLAIGSLAVLGSCATNAPQDTWQPKGPNAKMIDDLQQPVFAVAGIIGIIVSAAVAYESGVTRIADSRFRNKPMANRHSKSRSPSYRL